jgi:membrane protein involved in colicin uptake
MRYRVRHPEIAAGVALFAVVGMISLAGTSSAAYEPYEMKKETAAAAERQFAELVSAGLVADQRRAESLLSSKLVEGERAAAAAEAERQRKAAAEEASRSAARAAQAAAQAVAAKKKAPAAQPSVRSSGSSDWDRLAKCESGGNWASNTGNGYYGGLQFNLSTWYSNGGTGYPHQNTREEQIRVAENLRAARGYSPWPACSRKLGLR